MHSQAQLVSVNDLDVRRPRQAWLLKGNHHLERTDALPVIASKAEGSLTSGRDAVAPANDGGRGEVSPEKLLDDVRRTMVVDPMSARSAALRLVTLLSAPPAAAAPIVRGGLAPWQLRKIDRYLGENLAHSVQLPELAEQIKLSVSHFNRSFKVSRGLTPHQYIVKLRVELAQTLMLTTSDPLCSIALTCGLADQAHLTKLFRRHFGETPAAWRRQRFEEGGSGPTRTEGAANQLARSVPRTQSNGLALLELREGRHQSSTFGGLAIQRGAAALPARPSRVVAFDRVF